MRIFLFWILFIFSNYSYALTFEDGIFPELITSSRAQAMGNAFIAKVDDATAAFYNPAGLGTVRFPHLHISNFSLESNRGAMKVVTGGSGLNSFSNLSDMLSLDSTRKLLLKNVGTLTHSRLQVMPNFTMRYFSIGYLIAKRSRAVVNDTTTATGFEFADRLDMGPYAAINFSLFGGIIKFGATGTLLERKELSSKTDANATISLSSNSYYKGSTFDLTSGFRLTLPFEFLPTFAVTMHNTLKKKFSANGAGAPTTIPSNLGVGFSVTPQIGKATRIHFEVDYKDLTYQDTGISMTRRLLLGMEIDFARIFFMRFGYGDAYGSAGIGVRTKAIEFDLTTYAVDSTYSTYRGKEDRRFVLGLSSGF
jgi:hypothetical protein